MVYVKVPVVLIPGIFYSEIQAQIYTSIAPLALNQTNQEPFYTIPLLISNDTSIDILVHTVRNSSLYIIDRVGKWGALINSKQYKHLSMVINHMNLYSLFKREKIPKIIYRTGFCLISKFSASWGLGRGCFPNFRLQSQTELLRQVMITNKS